MLDTVTSSWFVLSSYVFGKYNSLQLQEASDYFTHTWSLGVEVQFYLVAPAILLIGKVLSDAF